MTGKEVTERQTSLAERLEKQASSLQSHKLEELCIILVDASGSMHDRCEDGHTKLEAVKLALPQLQVFGHRVAYGLVTFSTQATPLQTPTSNFGLIFGQMEGVISGSMTNISSAIRCGMDMFIGKQVVRRRMILLSDGQNNEETANLPLLIKQCMEEAIVIDTIAFGKDADEMLLREIAKLTGGVFYSAKAGVKQLAEVYAKLNFNVRYLTHKEGAINL